MPIRRLPLAILTALVLVAFSCEGSHAADSDRIGRVKTITGSVKIQRGTNTQPAVLGMPVFLNDNVQTGPAGSIGITFNDATLITLGGDSNLNIDTFVFDPHEKKLALALRLFRGTFSYLSGRIAKLAPEHVSVETPTSVIGIRGTHFLVKASGN